jgi:hypothetical protein
MKNNKMKKTYIIEAIIVILILFVVFWTYLRLKAMAEINTTYYNRLQYKPYEPFGIIMEETTWDGKLEPGRYTKSGIKILNKHER